MRSSSTPCPTGWVYSMNESTHMFEASIIILYWRAPTYSRFSWQNIYIYIYGQCSLQSDCRNADYTWRHVTARACGWLNLVRLVSSGAVTTRDRARRRQRLALSSFRSRHNRTAIDTAFSTSCSWPGTACSSNIVGKEDAKEDTPPAAKDYWDLLDDK